MRNEVEVATLLIVGTAARSADIKNTGHPDATAGCMAAPFDSTLPVKLVRPSSAATCGIWFISIHSDDSSPPLDTAHRLSYGVAVTDTGLWANRDGEGRCAPCSDSPAATRNAL